MKRKKELEEMRWHGMTGCGMGWDGIRNRSRNEFI